jgi:hypothetical protein
MYCGLVHARWVGARARCVWAGAAAADSRAPAHARAEAQQHARLACVTTVAGVPAFVASANGACARESTATTPDDRLACKQEYTAKARPGVSDRRCRTNGWSSASCSRPKGHVGAGGAAMRAQAPFAHATNSRPPTTVVTPTTRACCCASARAWAGARMAAPPAPAKDRGTKGTACHRAGGSLRVRLLVITHRIAFGRHAEPVEQPVRIVEPADGSRLEFRWQLASTYSMPATTRLTFRVSALRARAARMHARGQAHSPRPV